MTSGDLSSEWFKTINPNGKAPAIAHVKEDGTSVTVFESAACLLYMASEFDKEHKLSCPPGTQEYWDQISWATSPFLAGDRLTIADVAVFIFAHSTKWCNVDIDEFPNVKLWRDKLLERPAFQRGLLVPVPYQFSDAVVSDPESKAHSMMRKFGGQMIKAATEQWRGKEMPVPSDHANYQ